MLWVGRTHVLDKRRASHANRLQKGPTPMKQAFPPKQWLADDLLHPELVFLGLALILAGADGVHQEGGHERWTEHVGACSLQ